jgi:hypothetical protein
MKRVTAALLSLTILLALSACQPTPEKGTVVQKDSDRMLEDAKKGPNSTDSGKTISLSQQYGIPETYAYDAQGADGLLNIHVDAQVVVPEGSAMPIYRVQQTAFSQETVSAFFDALCGDAEMYIPAEQMTKEEIQQRIVNTRRYIAEMEKDPEMSDMVEMSKNDLANLEAQLETAPDTVKEERSYGGLTLMTNPAAGKEAAKEGGASLEDGGVSDEVIFNDVSDYTGLIAYEKYEDGLNGEGRSIQVHNNSNPTIWYNDYRNSAAGINFSSSETVPIIEDTDIDAETLSKTGIKPSKARRMVQDLLDTTGSGMVVDSIYLQNDEQKGNYDEAVRPAENYAYIVYCVRSVDGLPCSYIMGGSVPESEMTAAPWVYETMYFMVNSEGIFEMMWHNPIKIVQKVNEDAQLKPFSEIQEIFENMMSIEYEAQAEYGGSGFDFDINRVTLSLHRIVEQNSNESGLLVPAWNFYGKLTIMPSGDSPTGAFDKLGESFLTINAIDGSVIDTFKGY